MKNCKDRPVAIIALIFFAAWLFIGLPLIYAPGERHVHSEGLGVTHGEWLLFFGAIIGGFIGAGAAVMAVGLTIKGQRDEDTMKVRAAVRLEVTTYSKYVIGSLDVCKKIAAQGLSIPMLDAEYVSKALVDPVIYPAVSDRIGLLQRPQATIEFYMRIAEAKSNLSAMRQKASGLTQAQSQMTLIQPSSAEVVADSLITALQMARHIVADHDSTRTAMDLFVQNVTLKNVDEALAAAQVVFPNAESFQTPA